MKRAISVLSEQIDIGESMISYYDEKLSKMNHETADMGEKTLLQHDRNEQLLQIEECKKAIEALSKIQ